MAERSLGSILLVGVLLTAGCIGTTSDQVRPSSTPGTDDLIQKTARLDFQDVQPIQTKALEKGIEVPDSVEGLLFAYELEIQDPGEIDAWLTSPGGDRIEVVSRTATEATTVTGHLLLEPEPGAWGIQVETNAPGRLTANLTVQPNSPDLDPVGATGDTRPVIAVVDTGVNPYHEAFQAPGLATADLPERITGEGSAEPISVPVNPQEDYLSSLARDAGLWAEIPDQRLVHFEGTRLLGYQTEDTTLPEAPVLDQAGHGTSVADAALRQAPHALVVMVHGPNYDDGVEWAANQPWIDVVSMSWGPAVNAAGVFEPYAFGFRTPEVTHQAHEAGKLVFGASGNDPTPTVTDTTTGPPWVHAVSGAQPDTQSRAAMSGNLVDTVADWTQTLARYETVDETWSVSGTSFAAPMTAGIAADVIGEVREEVGHEGGIASGALVDTPELTVTNADLRDALNRSAVYWNTTDYGGPTDPGPSIPVAPTPWASMGWGYLDGNRTTVAVDGLTGEAELPSKSAQAQAFMEQHQEARQAYWQAR